MKPVKINKDYIGDGYPPYLIAELSANHNGELKKALDTITMAKDAGANAVKFQTYTADSMTIDCDNEEFKIQGGLWDGYQLYQLYQQASTPYEWHKPLFDHARSLDITAFSTPFDEHAVDFLEDCNVPAYKIASFEATDLPLLQYTASTGKPIILSTGLCNEDEIKQAVTCIQDAGCQDLILLHCISSYPAPIEQSNLFTLVDMKKRFSVPTGLSDHSLSNTTSTAAVALGACVIEKHVTLDRNDKGPDSAFSLEADELASLCKDTQLTWKALGQAGYECKDAEKPNRKFRRSLYFVSDIKQGEVITKEHIRRIRPSHGLAPKYYNDIIGKKMTTNASFGTPVTWNHVQ